MSGHRVGVDFSEKLLSRAHNGPDYIVADVESVPLRDESFDVVMCLDVLGHLPSLKVVEEAYRLLVEGGVFLLCTADRKFEIVLNIMERLGLKLPEGPHKWWDEQRIVETMLSAGFSYTHWSKLDLNFYRCVKTGKGESSLQ